MREQPKKAKRMHVLAISMACLVLGAACASFYYLQREATGKGHGQSGDFTVAGDDAEAVPQQPAVGGNAHLQENVRTDVRDAVAASRCGNAVRLVFCKEVFARQRISDLRDLYEASGEGAMDSSLPGLLAFNGEPGPTPDEILACQAQQQDVEARLPTIWLRAAEQGSVAAMRNYVSGVLFEDDEQLANLKELGEYKNKAVALAYRAARAGDLASIIMLASAMSPQRGAGFRSLLSQVAVQNTLESMTLYRQARRALSPREAENRATLDLVETRIRQIEVISTPAEISASKSEAERRIQLWRPIRFDDEVPALTAVMFSTGSAIPVSEQECLAW